jgi:hypothetical protein
MGRRLLLSATLLAGLVNTMHYYMPPVRWWDTEWAIKLKRGCARDHATLCSAVQRQSDNISLGVVWGISVNSMGALPVSIFARNCVIEISFT